MSDTIVVQPSQLREWAGKLAPISASMERLATTAGSAFLALRQNSSHPELSQTAELFDQAMHGILSAIAAQLDRLIVDIRYAAESYSDADQLSGLLTVP